MKKAIYVADITVTDPDTHELIEVSIFKHENGGMFGIDASYIDAIDDGQPTIKIADVFAEQKLRNVELFWEE